MKMETAILLLLSSIRIMGVSHPPVRVLRLQGCPGRTIYEAIKDLD